jgi:hypothetical protein
MMNFYGLVNPSFASVGITLNFIKPIIEYSRSLVIMYLIHIVVLNKTKNANARNSRHIGIEKNNRYINFEFVQDLNNRYHIEKNNRYINPKIN